MLRCLRVDVLGIKNAKRKLGQGIQKSSLKSPLARPRVPAALPYLQLARSWWADRLGESSTWAGGKPEGVLVLRE